MPQEKSLTQAPDLSNDLGKDPELLLLAVRNLAAEMN
jgi:hypothetical protein